jgi:hypothetical protein
MGEIRPPEKVLLIAAAASRYEEALLWGRLRAEELWGPLGLVSEPFPFEDTDYYRASMGPGLKKQFWAAERLVDPGRLPELKRAANAWEADYAALGIRPEPRPLNVDPGYLTLAKLVLASTKDHAHRLYLGEGVYGEVTLNFRDRRWQPLPWTYPDYRRADYQAFLDQCRTLLRQKLTASAAPR